MKLRIPAWVGVALSSVALNSAFAEQVYISEIHYNPKGSAPEYIEISNATASVLDLAEWEFTEGISYVFPEYSDGNAEASFLKHWERIVVSEVDEANFRASYPGVPADVRVFGPWSGSLSNSGERITLRDKNGVLLSTVDYRDGGRKWPVAADGAGHSLRIKSLLGSADDWRNWTVSLGVGGTPGVEPQNGAGRATGSPEIDLKAEFPLSLSAYDSSWKYHDLTEAPDAGWQELGFNDASWGEHPGMFGFDSSRPLPAPGLWVDPDGGVNWRRDSFGGLVTWYVRKEFVYNGATDGATLDIEGFLDDGAVFYLNGEEIERVRMPAGPVDHHTIANRADENTVPEVLVSESVSEHLVEGVNVLAVEVHNETTGSSDIVFGVEATLGPGSGSLVINEVNPGAAGVGFIEFYNGGDVAVDLEGYYLSDDRANLTKTAIGAGVVVPASGFETVGFAESGLSGGGELFLTHPDGTTVLGGVSLSSVAAGESIGRKPAGSASWFLFDGGTPGESNVGGGDLAALLELSEVHFDGDGNVDWVEVAAKSGAVDVGGLAVASERDFSDAVGLSGSIPAGGQRSWDMSFPVGGNGELTLYLVTGSGQVVATAEIDRNAGEESFQVFPSGSGEWYGSAGHTRDAENDPDRQTDVVINEIMCDPPSDSRNGEFVELYNRGSGAVDVSGWRFSDGINFEFPAGTSIAPGGYLVVVANSVWAAQAYPAAPIIGDFSGNLSNGGELLRLVDANGELVDEVDYKTGGDWPVAANGDGSSMELIHPDVDNDLPTAWRDSDESGKTSFESFEFSGTYFDLNDERTSGNRATDYKELHLHLVGDAHVILKNIRFERGGSNLLQNAGQDTSNGSSATGWLTQGTHHASHFEGDEFHLIADGHGDNRANRAEIDCTAMNRNDTLTLKFDGRWVSGKPTMIAQTFDHSWAKVVRFDVPDALGTPGAANSVILPVAPPVAGGLKHDPAVPTTADAVLVTAKVSLPATGGTVELRYREDTAAGTEDYSTVAMNDSGSNGDETAGDGVWTGRITDMGVSGRVVQFYVSAKNAGGDEVTLPSRGEARPAMYVVDNDQTSSDLKVIRWVISAYDRGAWQNGHRATPYNYKFPKLSNSYKNLTMIINESEIIYNAEVRPSGSPWHTGSRANLIQRAKFKMPGDNQLHGLSKYSYDNTIGAEGPGALYHNKLPRYWLYLMGHEHNESEFVQVIDGTIRGRSPQGRRNVVEIFEPIGNDLLDRNFGSDGSKGELFRVDDIFRFTDANINNGSGKEEITDRFWWYAGDQWEGPGRYQTQWLLRSNEAAYDYSTLINMLRTLSGNSYTEAEIGRLVDQRRCALMMAVRGYLGDWDNITLNRPKNSFFYREPGDGKFFFMHHDSDLGFQLNHANDVLVATHGGNRELRNWVRKPYNERIFRYYLAELLEKYTLDSTRVDTWFALEDAASRLYRPNSYRQFFTTRNRGSQMVGTRGELRNNLDVPITVAPVANTGADTISISGTAGYRVWEIMVEGHPEATFTWTSDTDWRIDGIVLEGGANALNVIGLDDDGKPAHLTAAVPVSLTKTGDGTPVAELDTDPKSRRLPMSNVLELDARDSRDPEGEALSFSWSTPATGVASFTDEGDGRAAITFDTPGLYSVGVSVSDGAGAPGTASEEIAVYGPDGFSTFGDAVLEGFWMESNTAPLGNSGGGSWYSLEQEDGRLTLFAPGDAALTLGGGNYPWISRALPESGDWVMETELEVVGLQFGDYMTGLMVSVMTGQNETRYAWGYTEGNKVTLQRVSGASTTVLNTVGFSASDDVVLRVRRSGANLLFDWRHDEGEWAPAEQVTIGAAATASQGGIFASTGAPETVRVAFDYVMLIESVIVSPFAGDLVVSEIMYKPDGGASYEFMEIHNTTGDEIALAGFQFPQGDPVDEFTFGGGATIAGGDYRLLVADLDAFRERYGDAAVAKVIGIWTGGSLANGGETVTLLDADGLVVFSVEYSDSGEWPDAPDDDGASLVLIDGATDPVSPGSWSASMFAGGSPGGRDGETLAEWQARTGSANLLEDLDGNGVNALLTYALGLDLAAGGMGEALPVPGTVSVDGKTYASLTFRKRIGGEAEGLSYSVEIAQGLSGWTAAPGSTVEVGSPDYVGDGAEEVTVRSSVALEDGLDAAQLRLRVSVN